MGKNYYLRWTAIFVLLVSVFASCQKEFDKYYELPAWMKGNAWEVLQSEGNYTIFLAAVEKGGFKELVDGKGILTVMAPNDDAFRAYLAENNYSSIDQMPLAELKAMINYHLLYYSFNKTQMANYQPFGADATVYGADGLFYKFRTHSQDPMDYNVPDPAVGPSAMHTVYHKERYLPVFSSYLFGTKNIDAKYNYEYFYPDSEWTGANGGFNVSNASVTEYAIPTDAGYIYKISAVLEPLETVSKQLAKESDYSIFYNVYNRFRRYVYDDANTEKYSPDDSLWLELHAGVPPIAAEWTYNGEIDQYAPQGVADYGYPEGLMAFAVNTFAPSNSAMTRFFDDYWGQDYASYNDLPYLPLEMIIENHVNYIAVTTARDLGIVFPELIADGSVKTALGNTLNFDPEETLLRKICVNGVLYGLGEVMAPDVFYSVGGAAFKYKRFTMAMYMLMGASVNSVPLYEWIAYPSYDADNGLGGKALAFMATDDMFTNNTFYSGMTLRFNPGSPVIPNTGGVQMLNDDDAWVTFSGSGVVFPNHVVQADLTPNRTVAQGKVYKTLYTKSYLFTGLNDDQQEIIISTADYNRLSGGDNAVVFPTFREMTEFPAYNGTVYELEGERASALVPETSEILDQLLNPSTIVKQYSEFINLLVRAGFTKEDWAGANLLVFAPSNDVIQNALNNGGLPPMPHQAPDGGSLTPEQDAENVIIRANLRKYLMRYFVNTGVSFPVDYPFTGALDKSLASPGDYTMQTFAQDGDLLTSPYIKLGIADDGNRLSVIDGQGSQISVIPQFPNVFLNGAFYSIDGLIKLAGE